MKIYKHFLWFLAVTFACISCEKVVDIKVSTSPSQLVIEGNITNLRETQYIKISRSVAYTSTNVYPTVSGAAVSVKDNVGNTWKFTETSPGIYSSPMMRGLAGRTYTLNVDVDSKNYTASSLMPAQVRADSLTLTDVTFGSTKRKMIAVHYTDPKGIANQYRYLLRINGYQTNRIYVFDDRLKDGNISKDELYPDNDDDDDSHQLKSRDVAEVEIQNIDKSIFDYWYSLRQQSRGGPGGGTIPGNPPSNLSNGALGYFSAHTYQTISVTVP